MPFYPRSLVRTLIPLSLLLALPGASQAAPGETIEVIDTKPASARASKPNMRPNPPPLSLTSQVYDFPTGLRIIMQSDSSHPIVSVLMVVDHGAGNDPDGANGTAHFVEHTWFRSKHGELPPIMTLIQDLGTQFNATTRPDTTDFRTVANAEYLPALLRLESLRLVEPYIGVTDEEIETEREVVRNEWRRRNEQSTNLVFDYLLKSVFPEGHPYHNRETNESLDNIKLPVLQKYFDDYYTPDKTTIVVVGDFEQAEARSLIFSNMDLSLLDPKLTPDHLVRYPKPGIENPDADNPKHWLTDALDPNDGNQPYPVLDPMKRAPRVTKANMPPMPAAPKQDVIPEYEAAVDNQTVLVGWALPGGFRGDDTNMIVLANTASAIIGGFNGVLRQKGYLDDEDKKRGLKDAGCFALPMKENSVLACSIEVTDTKRWSNPERVADLMIDQLAPLWNPELVTLRQQYVAEGINSEIANVLRSVDNVAQHFGGRAEDIGFHAHQTGSVTYHSDRMKEVSAIDNARMAQIGYEYLKRDRAAIAVVNPIPDADVDTTAETSSYHGASEGDSVIDASGAGMTAAAIAEAYVKPDLTKLVDKRLANGMRVVILPHGESPLVEATLVVGGGTWSDPDGIFNFVTRFVDDDWKTQRDPTGNDPLAIAAARTGRNYGNQWTTGLRAPAGNLDAALWMLREEMETTRPDLNYKVLWATKARDRFFKGLHGRGFHISDMSQRHLYPETERQWPAHIEQIKRQIDWSASDVRNYLDRHLQPANTTLVVVGNVDADEALRQSIEYFAGWQPRNSDVEIGPAPKVAVPPMGTGSKIIVFNNEKRTQTQVTRECRLNSQGVEDVQATAVLSNLIFDRTFSQLRVKEALAYSPGGRGSATPDGSGQLVFSSLAVNVGVGRTLEFFRDLTQEIEDGKVDDAQLTKYKVRRAREHGISAQSTSQMTGKLASALYWGQPWSMLTDAGEHIAAVDAKQLQRMVKGCNGRSITTLEGPAAVITPQLDEKGFTYEVVDYEKRGNEMRAELDPKGYKKHLKAKAKADKKKAKTGEDDGSADTSSETPPESPPE